MKKSTLIGAATMLVLGIVLFAKWQDITNGFLSHKTTDNIPFDNQKIIEKLTTAFADEWVATYQYWLDAKFVHGKLQEDAAKELLQHSKEELEHANMLATRIKDLGGTIHIFPRDLEKTGGCPLDAISDYAVKPVLEENIKGEQCAIAFYQDLLKMVEGKDQTTYDMVQKILHDEEEHLEDLTGLLKKLE